MARAVPPAHEYPASDGRQVRTDPRNKESRRRDLAGGKQPQECRWVRRCLRLGFWAAALLDVAPHPSQSPCGQEKEAAPGGKSAPSLPV